MILKRVWTFFFFFNSHGNGIDFEMKFRAIKIHLIHNGWKSIGKKNTREAKAYQLGMVRAS